MLREETDPCSLFPSVASAYMGAKKSCVPSYGLKCDHPALALGWGLVGKDSVWEGRSSGLYSAAFGPLCILGLRESSSAPEWDTGFSFLPSLGNSRGLSCVCWGMEIQIAFP